MLRRAALAVFLVPIVAGGCSIGPPQATSHSKEPSDVATCFALQAMILPLSDGGSTFKTPQMSTEQIDQALQVTANSAKKAADTNLRSEGVGLTSALISGNLPRRGTYMGQMVDTCVQIGLFRFPK